MNPEFWIERWNASLTGFHQADINPHLQQYWSDLSLKPGGTVFVPLCGKSLDMLWLRSQGFNVVGVELSALAVDTFFSENGLIPEIDTAAGFRRFRCDGVTLLQGDFFDLGADSTEKIDAIYDRASLIAMPPSMRVDYVAKLRELFPRPLDSLLVTMDYPQEQMGGPPFAVSADEVNNLYGSWCRIRQLDSIDILANEGRFRDRGVDSLHEKIYLIDLQR